ncbi:ROK family protein [Streptomyces sp. NPDC048514]|uniref:ROK family transcriptional regulator n=1 Tax=Streptomyces sp. NPDC048514 TaxID=3365564 RepID=UPI003710DAD7
MAGLSGRTVRDLRRESRSAVLQRLYVDGPMSRHALGPATGLSSGSVSNVVAELLADGLVEEAGVIGADVGRPRRLLRVRRDSGRLIGVDIGETRVRVELFDLGMGEIARTERPLGPRGYDVDAVVGHVADGVAEVLRKAGPGAAGPGQGAAGRGPGAAGRGPGAAGRGEAGRGPGAAGPGEAGRGPGAAGPGEAGRGPGVAGRGEAGRGPGVAGPGEAGPAHADLLGVGVGVPGIVEGGGEHGAVVHGQTIGWDAVPLERLLRTAVGLPPHLPYFIDNGAKALGQAEMWFGAGRGARNAVVVLFGSGVGACVVTEEAAQGRAVEWGHLTVRVGGRRCRCGARGCLEAYAGAEALVARWREAGGRPSAGAGEERALTELLAAARPVGDGAPDPVAAAVLAETAVYLGAGLSDLINLFQPERVLIGGWAGLQLGGGFLDRVRGHALAQALRHPASRVGVELGLLGPDAVTVGAAVLPLAAFFATGGRRPHPAPGPPRSPAWRAAVEGRLA